MKIIFTADQFSPTEFETGEDKARFANHFVRFVESNFKKSLFPDWFYRRLSMTFGHIAHYNRGGFFETFFSTPKGKVEFIEICLSGGGVGDPRFTYSDVEKELKEWLINRRILEKLQRKFEAAVEDIERAWLAAARFRNQAIR